MNTSNSNADECIYIRKMLKNYPHLYQLIIDLKKMNILDTQNCSIHNLGYLSNGEIVLVKLAHDLWEKSGTVSLLTVVQTLDKDNLKNVLEIFCLSVGRKVKIVFYQ